MLNKKQVEEIKEHLDKAQNPLFFFDNDQDGLCSFLLLQRYLGRGRGVPIRSFPELTEDYFRKIDELKADYVFILDKPLVSKEFFEKIHQINIPVVWIDHHAINREDIPDFVNYYNPLLEESDEKNYLIAPPVTYYCYQISQKKQDLWIAIIGCISDKFLPEFYAQFKKENPELCVDSDSAFDVFYKSPIGKIAMIFGFALKDRTTNVISMLKFLINAKTPYDVLDENNKNYTMHNRFKEINKKYRQLLIKAIKIGENSTNLMFFKYSGDLSISSDLSNELSYLFPEKIIVVIYVKGTKANISIRGKDIRNPLLKILEELSGATGGGHGDAVGAQVKIEDLDIFKKRLENVLGES
ncbi:MAG: hypothetical protein KKF68_03480 [Nanoarchaeota archaeon]|nr:hypothetical protein [Nanoarchaeota archaeon]